MELERSTADMSRVPRSLGAVLALHVCCSGGLCVKNWSASLCLHDAALGLVSSTASFLVNGRVVCLVVHDLSCDNLGRLQDVCTVQFHACQRCSDASEGLRDIVAGLGRHEVVRCQAVLLYKRLVLANLDSSCVCQVLRWGGRCEDDVRSLQRPRRQRRTILFATSTTCGRRAATMRPPTLCWVMPSPSVLAAASVASSPTLLSPLAVARAAALLAAAAPGTSNASTTSLNQSSKSAKL